MNNEIKKLKSEIESLNKQIIDIKNVLKNSELSIKNVLTRRGFNFLSSCPTEKLMIQVILIMS